MKTLVPLPLVLVLLLPRIFQTNQAWPEPAAPAKKLHVVVFGAHPYDPEPGSPGSSFHPRRAMQFYFLMPSGRLMSIISFDFGPTTFFAAMSCSVKRASKISPSVLRLRS